MDGLQMLFTRRSIRAFKKEPVDNDKIKNIIKAGKLAATARNVQPCEMVVIRNPVLLNKLSDIAETGRFIKDGDTCIVLFAKEKLYCLSILRRSII